MTTPSVRNKVRVAHLVSHPIQYFAPLYRALSHQPEINLEVLFWSGKSLGEHFDIGFGRSINWDLPLLDGYTYHLSQRARNWYPSERFDWRIDLSVIKKLISGKYDVIWLHGRQSVHAWIALLRAWLTGTPIFLRDDQTLLNPRGFLKRMMKRLILPIFYRKVIGLPVGSRNRAFFEQYGTRALYPACYAVGNEFLQARARDLKPSRKELRASFNITGDEPVILFCGKIIDSKQPLLLLDAFERVRAEMPCTLLFAGDGELRSVLEERIRSRAVPGVQFAGFLNQTELPKAYVSADIMVLPSAYGETWGMVVNEAMNFGLPIIVSNRVGCIGDLVLDGVNGLVFESGNLEALVQGLRTLVGSAGLRHVYGLKSLEIIANYTLGKSTMQITNAFLSVLSHKAREYAESSTSV